MFGDRLFGVLDSESKFIGGFDNEDRKIFETISKLIASKLALIEQTELVKKYTVDLEQRVEERTLELKIANEKLEYLASIDPLTEIANRRRLDELLEDEFQRAIRYGGELSLILFDIDHFKAVNDTRGHQVGDEVIAGVAMIAKEASRRSDSLGRWGGEEFLIIAPQTSNTGAVFFAEKLRLAIENTTFSEDVSVSASFGVASIRADESIQQVLKRADVSLYRAKELGRNRVETDTTS
jgi:diguanylate cyclase (GGDEF)-like protein